VRILPSKAQFARLAEHATHVPVWGELLSDRDTPVSAFLKLQRDGAGCLLESAVGGERWGRYSFIVTDPVARVEARGRNVRVLGRDGSVRERKDVDPLLFLREILSSYRIPAVPGLPRFTGGLVGYVAYDAVRWIERLESPPPDDLGFADMQLLLAETLVIFDSKEQKLLVLTHADLSRGSDAAYDEAVARVEDLARRLDEPDRPRSSRR
jgi:anthranilate synthase component 1